MKKRKNLDLLPDVIKTITVQAAKEETVFKLKAEQVLTDYANSLKKKK